jgi:hypothetical protein
LAFFQNPNQFSETNYESQDADARDNCVYLQPTRKKAEKQIPYEKQSEEYQNGENGRYNQCSTCRAQTA